MAPFTVLLLEPMEEGSICDVPQPTWPSPSRDLHDSGVLYKELRHEHRKPILPGCIQWWAAPITYSLHGTADSRPEPTNLTRREHSTLSGWDKLVFLSAQDDWQCSLSHLSTALRWLAVRMGQPFWLHAYWGWPRRQWTPCPWQMLVTMTRWEDTRDCKHLKGNLPQAAKGIGVPSGTSSRLISNKIWVNCLHWIKPENWIEELMELMVEQFVSGLSRHAKN